MNRERIMKGWDLWREAIACGEASWPRDEFEELLDAYDETVNALKTVQTRWVKLSERLPTRAGCYFVKFTHNDRYQDDPNMGVVLIHPDESNDGVEAWLEGVPEYVP